MAGRGKSRSVPRTDEMGHDVITGGVAPIGRQTEIKEGDVILGGGSKLVSLYRGIEEVADMWCAGAADGGVTVSRLDGRVLPRIKHVRCSIPLTDVTGASLDEDPNELELTRRGWYAEQMRTANRLTPVHHIIGNSDTSWHDGINTREEEERDIWRGLFWEPTALVKLFATYEGIYDFDWQRLREDEVLKPLEHPFRKAEKAGRSEAKALGIKLMRARSDIAVIKRVIAFAQSGRMEEAVKEHARLALIETAFNEKYQPHRTFTGGILEG